MIIVSDARSRLTLVAFTVRGDCWVRPTRLALIARGPGRWLLAGLLIMALCPSSTWAGRWSDAFVEAMRDPATWGPAAGALLIAASGYDSAIADWAVRETPIFGSPERALRASTDLRTATHIGMLAIVMLTPGQGDLSDKTRGWIVRNSAPFAAVNTAGLLKRATGRTRPDGSDRMAFPSGHSTLAFGYAAIGSQSLDQLHLSKPVRIGLRTGLTTLAAGSAWARVEAGVHYPTDVLAGAALGNFVAVFINEAIGNTKGDMKLSLHLGRQEAGVMLGWRF